MKHPILRATWFALCAILFAPAVSAQDDDHEPVSNERLQEIKAQKSAYITTQLSLTPEQAQQFWPIYNEMDEKREVLRREMKSLIKDGKKNGAEMTEAEAIQLLEKGHTNRQKELDLEKTYSDRFKKAIGAVKTVQLRKAEIDFNREVLRKFRDRMQERHSDGPAHGR